MTAMETTQWARMSELRNGSVVVPDSGFTCMSKGEARVVHCPEDGNLFVDCMAHSHELVGQLMDDGDSLSGLLHVKVVGRWIAYVEWMPIDGCTQMSVISINSVFGLLPMIGPADKARLIVLSRWPKGGVGCE